VRKKRLQAYPAAVLATARRRRLLRPEDRVLVALSAGPDSTALLAALAALRDAGEIAAVAALHVDHGLRPGAEEDAACAAAACARLDVPLARARVVVRAGNVQAEARRARYAALVEEADRIGATRVATGHTRTDQAETVLLRLLRGAGARGLAAIPPRRGRFVRPLIDRSREEGLRFLKGAGISWREDPTNETPRFARNRLRLRLWPALRTLAPSAELAIARTADLAREDERALSGLARELAGHETSVAIGVLAEEPNAVRRRVVRRLWRNATGRAAGLESKHVEGLLALLGRRRPGRTALPGGFEALCRYGRLDIRRPQPSAGGLDPIEIPGPGRYRLPQRGISIEIGAREPRAVPWPLELRTRRPGDRIRPEGGGGTKKLKSWLIDRKVPRETRDSLLVLASAEAILAVPELSAVAEGLGPSGAGLTIRLRPGG
jgi:tRNA(Ile)-lysidine synthase